MKVTKAIQSIFTYYFGHDDKKSAEFVGELMMEGNFLEKKQGLLYQQLLPKVSPISYF